MLAWNTDETGEPVDFRFEYLNDIPYDLMAFRKQNSWEFNSGTGGGKPTQIY